MGNVGELPYMVEITAGQQLRIIVRVLNLDGSLFVEHEAVTDPLSGQLAIPMLPAGEYRIEHEVIWPTDAKSALGSE